MSISLPLVKTLAAYAAQTEVIISADTAAASLSCSPDAAASALKVAADAGYFRPVFTGGGSRRIAYQPTPKALRLVQSALGSTPKALRAGISKDAIQRGLLRGWVQHLGRSDLVYMSACDQDLGLIAAHKIPVQGYPRCAIGHDTVTKTTHIFCPVLQEESPFRALESACLRWFSALTSDGYKLHFVTPAANAEALSTALTAFKGEPQTSSAAAELAALEAKISADKTGMLAITHAAQRAKLRAAVANSTAEAVEYQWLGEVLAAT